MKTLTPQEVDQQIQYLQKRGVKNTPGSRLRQLIKMRDKHNKMIALILGIQKPKPNTGRQSALISPTGRLMHSWQMKVYADMASNARIAVGLVPNTIIIDDIPK